MPPLRWEVLMDGMPRRLVRGRHFDVHPRELQDEARDEAARAGKIVRTVIDKMSPDRWIWIQFADGELAPGEACRCGGVDFLGLNASYMRCRSCGSLLLAKPEPKSEPRRDPDAPTGSEEEAQAKPRAKKARHDLSNLATYTDVKLVRYEVLPNRERFCGHGHLPDGRPVLLLVDFPVQPGDVLGDPLQATDRVHNVASFPIEPFGPAIDLDRLA